MPNAFRIYSLCVVKNEADVVAHCLREASRWSNRIFVLDNGSTDDTWEAVCACASDRIIPWKRDPCLFRESLRGDLFNAFRQDARPGDWWCRLDADEFYVDDPREFLAQVPQSEHVVWGVEIAYYLTHRDVEAFDFQLPSDQLLPMLRYYSVRNSEQRFMRHRARLAWGPSDSWPSHMGLVHRRRIRYRHYKYRSPGQIERRLSTRRDVIDRGGDFWWRHQAPTWRAAICDASALFFDDGSGAFAIDENLLPRHVEPYHRRFVKRLLHGVGMWP